MKKRIGVVLLISVVLWSCSPKKNNNKNEGVVGNLATMSVQGEGAWWLARHEAILSNLKKNPELILLGNSIFHSLDNEDRTPVWERYLNKYSTVNMGISGDRTENLIWRLNNGLLEDINPKVAVLLIGTNNTDGNHYLTISTPEELADGISTICEIVTEKLPNTKIVIMGILPYGYKPNHRNTVNKETNALISKFPKKNKNLTYIDISSTFTDSLGNVKRVLMPDYLHPNAEGHMQMFTALDSIISGLMVAK
ncbi:GDSL-type esterase/lipase family protein [Cellulophaga sp. F20128]|uniref:GDSL-type esterase/lipase family protein n=1 Tax=Cellulophaga sp. F20128 TaxID=2926413 RepID=UPI001FF3FE50|nr:GDSL-type esterase/lipase family protein [Cellulophaga sp. F20128]MCK0157067.1 GDSL-type esterase/lipase family protein [Cellulophaga sp. F20128]